MLEVEIGFLAWMAVGVPVAAVLLPITWLILLRLYPPGELSGDAAHVIRSESERLGPASRGEKATAAVFLVTALAWVLRQPGVTAPIIGASKMAQLEQAVEALDISLSDEEAGRLEEPYRPHRVLGF